MCPPFRYLSRILKFILCLSGLTFLCGQSGELSNPIGALSVSLPAGSPESPTYKIVSPGIKGNVVFRGQVKQVSGDTIIFHRVGFLSFFFHRSTQRSISGTTYINTFNPPQVIHFHISKENWKMEM